MAVLREATITTAVITMLGTALGVPVGDHGTKDVTGVPIDTTGQYTVLRRIDGGRVEGSLGDGHQDVTFVYQVDSVARSRSMCEGLAARVAGAMTDIAAAGGHTHTLAGTGWKGGLRVRQTTGMPQLEGTDAAGAGGVWVQRERFEVTVHRA